LFATKILVKDELYISEIQEKELFLLFLSLHVNTSLARTENTILELITRVNNLTQSIRLGTLCQRHLEHSLMNMRIKSITKSTILSISTKYIFLR
jgi:hypothetical protein